MTPPLPNFTTLISSACGVSYVYFFLACATVPFPVVIYLVSYDPPLKPPGLSGLSLFLLNKIWGSPARKIQFQHSKVGRNGGFANLPMVGRARRTAAPTQSKLVKTPSHAKVYKVGGHGVVSCVSLSSSFPARPSPVAFLVRPPSPTLCSSRSPPPTVAPSLRRSNHHVFKFVISALVNFLTGTVQKKTER